MNYIEDIHEYTRYITKPVTIGGIDMGSDNPVRIQTMTNTDTNDIKASLAQIIKIVDAGADYVRLTAQGKKEIESLKIIQNSLKAKNISIPIIADIHFNPKIAELAAGFCSKVRINPGNYTGKKSIKPAYTNKEYQDELNDIKQKLLPLIEVCRKNGTAIRIGINHGSLSNRIMNRYGDTPEGMVASAMEFLHILSKKKFHNIVISMKASNVQTMVQSCRLLALEMKQDDLNYPIHLGVTEAGEGEDGRIKSAIGIGALLNDGIGDTIRVSLTENPVNEIPVAEKIVNYCTNKTNHQKINGINKIHYNPYKYQKRLTYNIHNIGGKNLPIVIVGVNSQTDIKTLFINKDTIPDYIYLPELYPNPSLPNNTGIIVDYAKWKNIIEKSKAIFPLINDSEFLKINKLSTMLNFVEISNKEYSSDFYKKAKENLVVFILSTKNINGYADLRAYFNLLLAKKNKIPVIIKRSYKENNYENLQIKSASDTGPLFIDGFGDGIFIFNDGEIATQKILSTSFSILQASRVRISKAEYISCPGCGRTLFNLEETLHKIKLKTSGLKGIKIGVMGCIVNGPGEMADADYGYVGAGRGKITLYKNHKIVKKNIPEKIAVEELVSIIKDNGDWQE